LIKHEINGTIFLSGIQKGKWVESLKLNGTLMSRDTEVAKIVDGELKIVNAALLPLYLKRRNDVEGWLEGRAIDGHRTNSRLLKKALRLNNYDDISVVLKVNAATITDTYWFRGENDINLTYQDIVFRENIFDNLALYGDPDSFNYAFSPTPELTNIGSYEKCWKLVDGHWWLYKQGKDLERFSEMFISELGKSLGLPMAEYELDGEYIRSRDFTDGASVNYEAVDGIVGENEDYAFNFQEFDKLSPKIAEQYIGLIYLDSVCFNMDRHTKNYGILRDSRSGDILALAPNFDNNVALFSRGYPKSSDRENDKLIELFLELLEKEPKALQYFNNLRLPRIETRMISACADNIPIDVNHKFLSDFLLNGDRRIRQYIQQISEGPKLEML
jgi:hypothetical protein